MTHPAIDLAVFDMAGTTIEEGSIVYEALRHAVETVNAHPTRADLDAVKGMDKINAIRTLLTGAGIQASDTTVQATFARFTEALRDGYLHRSPAPMPGANDIFAHLRDNGIAIALTTGFTREIADTVLHAVGWNTETVDAVITTDDVPAGRPAPYMIHEAMRRTHTINVRRVLSAGDTIVDIQSAKNAGAISLGVLSGDTAESTLRAEHPDHLLPSIADLFTIPELN